MNVRLQYDVDFLAGVYYNSHYFHNTYSVSMDLLTQNIDREFTNIAMDRLKYFLHVEMDNTVFVWDTEVDTILTLQSLDIDVTTLPEAPFDQIVGMMLYCKLNAIMEDQMLVTALSINSHRGDRVWYQHESGESLGPFANSGWWDDPSTQHCNVYDTGVNVVKINTDTWADHDLYWPGNEPIEEHNENTVVHINFSRNENK